jgi:Ribonucleases P/MRP protein subunit POP1
MQWRRLLRTQGMPDNLLHDEMRYSDDLLYNRLTNLPNVSNSGALNQLAFQSLPRGLRRRAASHNIKRIPVKLREKAKSEVRLEQEGMVAFDGKADTTV